MEKGKRCKREGSKKAIKRKLRKNLDLEGKISPHSFPKSLRYLGGGVVIKGDIIFKKYTSLKLFSFCSDIEDIVFINCFCKIYSHV